MEKKEGFDTLAPGSTALVPSDSVDEIEATGVIEKVPNVVSFIEECYRLLKLGAKMTVNSAHFSSSLAWASPLNVRGVSEASLNFASKDWRKQAAYSEAPIQCNFEIAANFAVENSCAQRSDDARMFWMQRFNNVVQAVILTLIKKEL